jgi:hypothetical protein
VFVYMFIVVSCAKRASSSFLLTSALPADPLAVAFTIVCRSHTNAARRSMIQQGGRSKSRAKLETISSVSSIMTMGDSDTVDTRNDFYGRFFAIAGLLLCGLCVNGVSSDFPPLMRVVHLCVCELLFFTCLFAPLAVALPIA